MRPTDISTAIRKAADGIREADQSDRDFRRGMLYAAIVVEELQPDPEGETGETDRS